MSTQGPYRYSHTVGAFGVADSGFMNPVDVALGNEGRMYVINRTGRYLASNAPEIRVVVCTVDEDFLGQFSHGGSGDGQMVWPVSIGTDKDENIYVSDEALHRISIFNKEWQFLSKWGTKGDGDGEFNGPAGIAFDKDENLLVVDALNNRVQKFTKGGQFLGGWGRAGSGDGEFNLPWGITVDRAADVYVSDWRNDRIQKFDSQGNHLATWGTSGQGNGEFHRPSGVAVDKDGDISVADWGNERVQVLGPDGSFRAKLRGDATLSKWSEGYFKANVDEWKERQKADMEPELDLEPEDLFRNESAAIEKLFWGPISVKVDDLGRLYVVDSCRHRIQVYQKG